jgi:hypothetical protein
VPNLKIYVEEAIWREKTKVLAEMLTRIPGVLCEGLTVNRSACQVALIPVCGLEDQAQITAELLTLPKPDRSRQVITAVCERLRDMLSEATGEGSAVRAMSINPETYVVVRS